MVLVRSLCIGSRSGPLAEPPEGLDRDPTEGTEHGDAAGYIGFYHLQKAGATEFVRASTGNHLILGVFFQANAAVVVT